VHHLDLIDHHIFQFFQALTKKCTTLYTKNLKFLKQTTKKLSKFTPLLKKNSAVFFKNQNYKFKIKK
jgi:hypothetical protein